MNTDTIQMLQRVQGLGFSLDEALKLRRIAMTFSRWDELECGNGNDYGSWTIARGHKVKGEFTHDDNGFPFMEYHSHSSNDVRYTRIADRERGAEKRLAAIMAKHPELVTYHQGDPRGASLYIVRKSDLNGSDIHSTYTRGVAVYK